MTNTVKKSCNKDKKTDCLINARSLGISTNSSKEVTPEAIRDWLISLPPDFPVLPSQSQEKEKELMTQETCGRKQSKSSKSSSRNMSFLKTSPACYLQNRVWMKSQGDLFHTSLPFSGTWIRQGIMLSGKCWALRMSELRIEGKGCGYWRTPHASDGEGGIMEMRDGCSGHYKLRDHVQTKNSRFWPTPTKQDSENDGGTSQYKRNSVPLNPMVKKFPTPQASMMTEADMEQAKFAGNNPDRPEYCDAGKGSLNPDWVEWLMGWIPGLTSLEPMVYNDIKIWRSLYANDKCRTSRSSKNISQPGNLRAMSETESKAQASQRQEPSKQQKIKSSISVLQMPYSGSCSNRRLGKGASQTQKMQNLRESIPTETNEEGSSLPKSRMPEGTRQTKCNKKVVKASKDKNMSMVWQGIHIQASKGENLWAGLWQLAFVEQEIGWWSIDPADTGDIPRVATGVKDRVNRLKAIGNGQVPLCMAVAWEILYCYRKKL